MEGGIPEPGYHGKVFVKDSIGEKSWLMEKFMSRQKAEESTLPQGIPAEQELRRDHVIL